MYGPATAEVGSSSAILGLRYAGAGWGYLAAGAPFDSASTAWGAVGGGRRIATAGSRISLGADLGAHAYGFRDTAVGSEGAGGTLELLPLVAFRGRAAALELRSGALHHSAASGGVSQSRTLHASDARLLLAPGAALRVVGEGRFFRAPEGDYPYLGGGAELALPRGELHGFGGRWLSDDIPTAAWGAGAALRLGERMSLHAAVQQDVNEPLVWSVPRRSWSVGASRRLGPAPNRAVPVLAATTAGRVTLRIPRSASVGAPSVAGDFSRWELVPMVLVGGEWTAMLTLPRGVHRYAFRLPDGSWFVPEGTPGRTDDGMGGIAAVLVIP